MLADFIVLAGVGVWVYYGLVDLQKMQKLSNVWHGLMLSQSAADALSNVIPREEVARSLVEAAALAEKRERLRKPIDNLAASSALYFAAAAATIAVFY